MRLLLCLAFSLLLGCSHYYTLEDGSWEKRPVYASCIFGGDTEEADAICAERNFGKDGATYIQERAMLCKLCTTTAGPELGATDQYCALNCSLEN